MKKKITPEIVQKRLWIVQIINFNQSDAFGGKRKENGKEKKKLKQALQTNKDQQMNFWVYCDTKRVSNSNGQGQENAVLN